MIDRIQAHLEQIYQLDRHLNVLDYLVDQQAAQRLGGTGRSEEELLVYEEGDSLEMALYLDATLVADLSLPNEMPVDAMERNLSGYCQATEGVSHFLYLTHTANHSRTVSLLEMEAQAEVDKFASCVFLKWGKGVASWGNEVFERLFSKVSYRKTLNESETFRYVEANRLASRYCRSLLKVLRKGHLEGLLTELRYHYRLGANAKLQRMASRV